jgi:hypothetical protein
MESLLYLGMYLPGALAVTWLITIAFDLLFK